MLCRYLDCVFEVLFHCDPGMSAAVGMSCSDMAATTASEAFTDLGLGQEDIVSLKVRGGDVLFTVIVTPL